MRVQRSLRAVAFRGLLTSMLLIQIGCGGSQNSNNTQQGLAPAPPPSQLNSYFGTSADIWSTTINHTTSQVNGEDRTQNGNELSGLIIGNFTNNGGFLALALTTVPTNLNIQPVGFALEVPGRQAMIRYGNLSQPLIPLAPTNACTSIGGTVTYDYLTIPGSTSTSGWSPNTDSTYGTFQVTTDGSTWNFANITQFTLAGMSPANPGSGLPTGFCGSGTAGYTVSAASNATNPPVATVTMGFGPSGFFLEDNGSSQVTPVGVVRSNALGAGAGAIGAIQPSSALSTGDVVARQYLGFYYQPGNRGEVTQLASFGCSGAGCPTPPSPTAIIGGIFPNDDPNLPAAQNVTIDLGAQDANNNGLYPSATITVSGSSFPAAAVVGQLEQKYAIFVIGENVANGIPQAIYLFQQ